MANPLSPRAALYRKTPETATLVDLINGLRHGVPPAIEPNPYLREYASRRQTPPPGITFDANVSPLAYAPVLRPSLATVLLRLLLVIGLMLLSVFVFLFLVAGPPPR